MPDRDDAARADLPEPLTPADCDLNGLKFMPLEVARVMQSTLFGTSNGDEFKAAFALWCASWYERPAASLPNDERMLEFLSKAKAWKKVRAMALHGWVLCSDGRLYHQTVAKAALSAWDRRVEYQDENDSKNERQKRWRDRCKALGEQLRALGVTPPRGASLETLERLLVDTKASTQVDGVDGKTSTRASTVDGVEIGKTGTGTGTGTEIPNTSPDGLVGRADLPPCPVERIVAAYHEALPELPSVRILSEDRRKAARRFWKFALTQPKSDGTPRASNADEAISWTRAFFERVRENDFLMGRIPRVNGHAGWECDFDFLLSPRGMKHVIEKTREQQH